ncbi:NADPH-dependent glutamate synthase [[Eubacterium] cellulosolvens]
MSDESKKHIISNYVIEKQKASTRPVDERINDFKEVSLGLNREQAILEANRCLQCLKPKCILSCPIGIDIPAFIKCIANENFEEAINKIREKNGLADVTGRVCPQEKLCEAACVLANKNVSIAIGALERFAADVSADKEIKALKPTGKKIAVIGSGPAGLTAAVDLAALGYEVTIYEAFHESGGVLTYGIPEFRLPKEVIGKAIKYVKYLGVKIEKNVIIGKSLTINDLFELGYDCIFIGSGAGAPKFLHIPGENLNGVYSANEFLTRCNLMRAYKFPEHATPVYIAEKVAVIGGGNVAMDSARTALRLGANDVHIVYRRSEKEMPARIEEVKNAKDEGVKFMTLANPLKIIGNNQDRVVGLECIKMELGEPDASGRRRPVEVEDSNFNMNVNMVIVAIGQKPNPIISRTTPELKVDKQGYIIVDNRGRTSLKKVWAAGDIVPGPETVIEAMSGAKNAVKDMNIYLKYEEEKDRVLGPTMAWKL